MGGLFGGGGDSSSTVRHEWGPPADTRGSKIPGDDKMYRQAAAAEQRDQMAETKANKTLLGKSAGKESMGGADMKKKTAAQKSAAVNYA